MGLQFPHSQGRHHNNSTMALIAGYTLTPAHIGGPWSLTGPYTVAQNTQVILRGGLGKREAEPEADAYYGLGGYGGYGATYGLVSGGHNAYGAPVPCRDKRSAEAWYGLGGAGAGLGGYGAAVPPTGLPVQPLVTAWNGAVVPRKTPAVEAAEADHFAAKWGKRSADSEADAYYGYGGYGGYGLGSYGAYNLGYGYGGYGKRSADSEADAYYGYGGYGGYGLGLYGKSAPCVNAANIPVPCTYGKRSADSDAYYGYGGAYTGLGYGGYGYGGLGYGYGK